MSIATVVTRGYGTFGSVNLLPTLGYTSGVIPVGGGWFEAVYAYAPGLVQMQAYVPGSEKTVTFVPGFEQIGGS